MTETGIRRTGDGGVFCEQCGADLSKENSAEFTGHADGRSYENGNPFYVNIFKCRKCGALMSQMHERRRGGAEIR